MSQTHKHTGNKTQATKKKKKTASHKSGKGTNEEEAGEGGTQKSGKDERECPP